MLPCPAAPGRPSHHRRSPGPGVLPASGRNHRPKAQADVWAHGPRVHGWDLVPVSYLVNESDSVHQQLGVSPILLFEDGHQVGPGKSTCGMGKEAVMGWEWWGRGLSGGEGEDGL